MEEEETVMGREKTLTLTNEGTTTITAWAINEEGKMSESSTIDVNIDNEAPMEPSITLSKAEGLGDGIWYGENGGTVTITCRK